MKRIRKSILFVALASPVMFSGSCVTGIREALIEGGFAFVEETAVEALQTFIPIGQFLGVEEHGE